MRCICDITSILVDDPAVDTRYQVHLCVLAKKEESGRPQEEVGTSELQILADKEEGD